ERSHRGPRRGRAPESGGCVRVVVRETNEEGDDCRTCRMVLGRRRRTRPDLRDQVDVHTAARAREPHRWHTAAARRLHADSFGPLTYAANSTFTGPGNNPARSASP